MSIKHIIIIVFIFGFQINAFSQVLISGAIRNDAAYTWFEDEHKDSRRFDDILENKLILRYRGDGWKFYGDGRLYLYYADTRDYKDEYEAKIMRSFIRYNPSIGDFTLGKTYINFGNSGIFNPFEIQKNVILSDLSNDKEGLLAVEFILPVGDLSGIKLYSGTYENEANASSTEERCYAGGASIWTNALNFDAGIVGNRLRENSNIAGIYLKGDVILGVQAAYAFHYNDEIDKPHREANLGFDYSFFDAHLIISSIFYYNQNGAKKIEDYIYSADGYFFAKYYIFSSIKIIYDEFLNFQAGSFSNLIDNSSVIYPSVEYLLADGLSITAAVYFFTGKKNMEFSIDTAGFLSSLLRVEAKF
ncbi:MAG: hypothetical protein JW864_12780 [Spirochaetes bacterium]|nr:hypothetical protein [Spirochaetota bacterium]